MTQDQSDQIIGVVCALLAAICIAITMNILRHIGTRIHFTVATGYNGLVTITLTSGYMVFFGFNFPCQVRLILTLQPSQCHYFRIKSFILYTVVYLLFLPKPFSFWRYNWKKQLEWLSFIRVKFCLVFSFKSFILVRRQRHCH